MAGHNDPIYTKLPVDVRLDPSESYYEFGVTLDGAWVTIAARKTGGINDDIARAKAAAETAKKSSKSKPAASDAGE
jgi:hypothetical protein